MRISPNFAAAFWLCVTAAGPIFADGGGGGGDDRSRTSTCGSGEVWDSRSQKCVKAENGVLPDKALAENAFALAKAGRYEEALAVLNLLQEPNTAVALNYRGYATRKLGRVEEGIGYYLKSVALDPQYAQVREYLGEAYVEKGDITGGQSAVAGYRENLRDELRRIYGSGRSDCRPFAKLTRPNRTTMRQSSARASICVER
jgi:tetratricopeptide (TPR) repeat protein